MKFLLTFQLALKAFDVHLEPLISGCHLDTLFDLRFGFLVSFRDAIEGGAQCCFQARVG
jgi:hypothetical protein